MSRTCPCGMTHEPTVPAHACPECGVPTCATCALTVESRTYCRWCATTLTPAA